MVDGRDTELPPPNVKGIHVHGPFLECVKSTVGRHARERSTPPEVRCTYLRMSYIGKVTRFKNGMNQASFTLRCAWLDEPIKVVNTIIDFYAL